MIDESIRVLIVDDKLQRDDHIEDMLSAAGFETRVVNDCASAAGAVDVWRPTATVLDLRSPSSEARRFGATLANRPEYQGVPVVLVAELPNLLKWLPVIPAGLVPTPVDADHLVATVLRVARKGATLTGAPLASR
jgi:DNA-binding NtrC family response regulator